MSEKFDPQKKYIQMNSMISAKDKISRYLDEISSSNPYMYSKTKTKYYNLACDLVTCVNKIGYLIGDEQLKSISISNLPLHNSINVPENLSQHNNFETANNADDIVDYKTTEARFRTILAEGANIDYKYDEVNHLARLLYRWFDTRFPNLPSVGFKYRVEWFPDLISNFILAFGKYMHEQRLGDFYHEVELWCDNLNPTQQYTVPYCVFNITKSTDPDDYTVEAVLANDLLFDKQLYLLSEYEFPMGCAFYDCETIIQKVRDINPDLGSELRFRITKQNELLKQYNFTPSDTVL